MVWPKVKESIRAAFQKTDVGDFASCEGDVLSGNALLWVLWNEPEIEAAWVTKIIQSERSVVCEVQACAGRNVLRNKHLTSRIEDYARANGCDSARIVGREGWQKVFPEYSRIAVILERKLK